ncbi:Protein kinase superfamily protein [Striga hermonthica]|uniref:Protein kinase superfamily protein n=1 Tax=Striga hermonthica TaxID=68872 RepID=A0A9N7NFK0_STRHE|nr:Protein kinase superfamily protein [Striga hermonthica]
MILFLIFLVFFFNLQGPRFASSQEDECQPASCHPSGPIIRFPFRLIGRHPARCGYPGFDLSCNPTSNSPTNSTEFVFQFPVRASARHIVLPIAARATVQEIDYRSQVIRVSVLNGSCLPARVPQVNSTPSPFEMHYRYYRPNDGYTLFNCSGGAEPTYRSGPINCLGHGGYRVFAYQSYYSVTDWPLSMCVKMYNISYISDVIFVGPNEFPGDDTQLHWSDPSCGDCEAMGRFCRLRRNGANNETECYEIPREPHEQRRQGLSRNITITIVLVSIFVTAVASSAAFYVLNKKHKERKQQRRIERFLDDYKALRPMRYTYSDIKRITDGFRHKLGQGGYGTVFKGQLSSDIPIAVKILNHTKGNNNNKGEDFLNEVATIGKIRHVNVVRLVGYCADGYQRALVYEYLENDSLEKYISSGNQGRTLGWEKMLQIAIGIAKGIDYLHQGCNQRILHFDIKPHNILLDHNLNPKVADFGLAKLCSKEQSIVTMTAARGTVGYIAPEVFSRNFGRVSYKSDIYSFGMLLLDMVGGRRSFGGEAHRGSSSSNSSSSSEIYFPEWMYKQLEKGEDIAIEIDKVEESSVVRRLIIVGLWCIQWYPADRPSTKVVIRMLEGESMPIMPPNPFAPSKSSPVSGSSRSSFATAKTSFVSATQ